ncbi:MAG: MobQ family relaxase [Geminicoccaceae bacterium]|nr:MobA/MobL family protein [Geminicoccaceae bacterium]
MAIYHLQVKTVSRRDGRSSVAAAAYRSGERLRDQRLGIEHDYTRKQGVLEADIMAPEGAPEWVYEREELWNAAEAAESRKDAKVAREYEIALPHELTPEQRSELVFDYAGWLAERHKVVVDVAIHAPHRDGDQRNHHAHLLTTTREVDREGLGAKTRALDVSRTSSALIEEAREMWAEYCNDSLARAKVQQQELDHRSYERQGLDKAPTLHMGPEATAMERRGEVSRIGEQNRLIQTLNQAREIAREQFERAKEAQ